MSHLTPRGILRNTDRNIGRQATSQSVPNYGSDEVYSHERSRNYRSDPANTPIFVEDEDLIQSFNSKSQNSKSQNTYADLYAQAMAEKYNLGLLDGGNSSALNALRSYDSHIDSPSTSPEKKQNQNPHSSQLSKKSFQQMSGHEQYFYNDLEEELSPYKYTGTSQNLDPDHPVAFKPITDLNLNSVDDEDEFLYGDSNPLPSENSSFQKETTHNIRSDEPFGSGDLLDVETPGYDKYQKSLPFSKSNDDGRPGIKLSISTFKKRSSWNYNDDPIAENISAKQELSLNSKQYKESFDAYSNRPSALNEGSYEPHSYLPYNLDNQSRQNIPFKTSKESSLNFPERDSPVLKISDSPVNQPISTDDKTKSYEAAVNLLRKQLNLDKSSKSNLSFDEQFYSKYNELPQNERRVIYDTEKKTVDKSSLNKPLKLLINVQQGDSSPSKRVVQVKESNISSGKYNKNLTKAESSSLSTRNLKKNEDLEVDKNVYEPEDLGTRRVVRDKTKVSREPTNVSSKSETRALPKRYIEKSHKKNEESSTKQKPGEKLPKKYSDKYHFIKEGMESYYGVGSKSKSQNLRSPERRWSPSYSPKHRSPSYSPKRYSPEYRRRRSPSYSPPSSYSRNRSPSYRHRDHSPSYRSRDTRRRSPERSSRRERRSYERSPHGHSRYHSRDRSPCWPEKESKLSQDTSSVSNLESKKKERIVIKRGQNFDNEEISDDEQRSSVAKLSDKLKGKEPPNILKDSESIKSSAFVSKKRKMAIPDEDKEDAFQKPQRPDAVTKIIHGLGLSKKTSDPFTQTEKGSEITQDSPDTKEKRTEVMNSLLNRLGISPSTSTTLTTVAPATSWSAGSTDSQGLAPAITPQQLHVNQFGLPQHYPQQLPSTVPQMYPQYMYGTSAPPVTQFPPFNTPPPMYPQPISPTSAYSYPPPVLPITNTNPVPPFSGINFQINSRAANPNSKGRISCLKPVPVVNSNQPTPQPSVVWNQNNLSSPTKPKTSDDSKTLIKGTLLPKNLSALSQELNSSSDESEQNMIEKYKKLLENKEILLKKLTNTSNHTIAIRKLQTDLEQNIKLPKSAPSKQLISKCSNLFDRTNEELKRYIDEAKRVSAQVKELQAKIKPEILDKIAKEVPEKKVSEVRYTGFDARNHWCESCNLHISTIPKMMEHLHSETHLKHVDPWKVITKEPPKESYDNSRLWPVKGVEFIQPVYSFYCSLCSVTLTNPACAEYHLKGSSHIEKYLTFLNENPVYERKRDIFKEAAIVTETNEKKLKTIEECRMAKQLLDKNYEIRRQKTQDALKEISDKLQRQKDKDKETEELDEFNSNARMSPQNQKSSLKLTLINEKSKTGEPLESSVAKGSELKPKTQVVYIGRAPNYKPRPKKTEKKSYAPSESKKPVKVEEGKDPNTSSKDEHITSDFTTSLLADEKIKSSKKLVESTQSHCKNQIEMPKKIKKIPGCQNEAEAKESEKVRSDSNKQKADSSVMPTDNSEINEAIKNFIRSRKNAAPIKVDENMSGMKTPPELPLKISSPVLKSSPKISSPLTETSPKVSSPVLKSSPKVSSPVLKSSPKVSSPILKSSPKVSSPVLESSPKVSAPVLKTSPKVSPPLEMIPVPPPLEMIPVPPPLPRDKPLSEEERDFFLLGICKSDMEPLAIPRPPPSNLIHNHSDVVSKVQSFLPPIQIPPPNIISNVPPPNMITSQVPPPNITSQVPPPNITSQVPPPTLVLQWSSEHNQQSSSVLSNVSLSNNNIPSVSEQFSHATAVNENTGVMDMEIDNDLVYTEIKVGSDVPTEKELPVLGEPSMNEPTPSSLPSVELCTKSRVQQASDSDRVTKEEDDRLIVKNVLISLMDSVSDKISKELNDGKNSIESISDNLLLSSNKTIESNEKSSDHKSSLNPSSFEQSISFPQSENEEKSIVENNEKDIQESKQLVSVSSEINVQYNTNDEMHINDLLIENASEGNNSTHPQKMEVEEIHVTKKEQNLNSSLTPKTTDFQDVEVIEKPVSKSCQGFETETCEFFKQDNNTVATSSEDKASNDVAISSEVAVLHDEDKMCINDPLIKGMVQNVSEENNVKNPEEMEIEEIHVNKEAQNLNSSLTLKTTDFQDIEVIEKPVSKSCQNFVTETYEFLKQDNNTVSTSLEDKASIDIAISSEVDVLHDEEDKMCINDSLIKGMVQNVSEENNAKSSVEMEIEEIHVNKEEQNLNSSLTPETTDFQDVEEIEKPVSKSCQSFETETCEFFKQENNTVSTSSEDKASNGVAISSEVAVLDDEEDKMCINDPLIKGMVQNVSEENNVKSSEKMEIEEIHVNKEEQNLNSSLTPETTDFQDVEVIEKPVGKSCQSFETETCQFLKQDNNTVSTSLEDKASIDIAISSEVDVLHDEEDKMCINDSLIKGMVQNVSEENSAKSSEEMEIEEIHVNKEEQNLNSSLTPKTTVFQDVEVIEKPATSSCHSIDRETSEVLEQDKIILSTSSEGRTSSTNDSEKVIENARNLSNSNSISSSDKTVSEEEQIELIEDQLAVAKRSPTSSSIIEIDVKEEINVPIETFQLENLSCKQSTEKKSEIKTETVAEVFSKSPTLTEVAKIDQNFPVKSMESSQDQSLNDFISEDISNMKEKKEAILSEDFTSENINKLKEEKEVILSENSKSQLEECESEDILSISTDGQPFLNENEESANKTEELKGELNSDTDEYETAEN